MSSKAREAMELTTPSQLLHYLPTYQVLICLTCRYAIQPGAITRHMKDIHQIHRSTRRSFVAFASGCELVQPENVVLPDETQFPVPFLPIQEGFACCFEECAYLCVTHKRMEQHWRCLHHVPASDGSARCKPVPLQTFFRGNALKYFTNPALLAPSPASKLDRSEELRSGEPHSAMSDHTVRFRSLNQHSSLIISDQELLDHYKTSTYKTLAYNTETERVFGGIVITLASQFPFLKHGVMACAALHLASANPLKRRYYLVQSLRHQDQAVPEFRQTTLHVDRDNSEAVLAFSFFLVICALNSETEDPRLFLSDGHDQQLHWINILRNGCSMLCPFWDELTAGSLGPFAALWQDNLSVAFHDPYEDPLLAILLATVAAESPNEVDYAVYHDAAVQLIVAFAFLRHRGAAATVWDALNAWPMRVTPAYLALLQQDRPFALLLLAYYAILLRPFRGEWFLAGRAEKMIYEIARRFERASCPVETWDLFVGIRQEYFAENARA
ncbi:uncharacterized protein BO97DRAFT_38405 [Aspergillus homomorphus CBS 101889]|uniref:C2H2-type domain-containing protein n=1 Tax=Aspergillus homomorphus (strain CBS 101889) TaxID=1450537 RepID=A0A395I0S1_ASPHC|nr:hypothetical protein BO97DRAFT_38405 [Aspergillus homomorphus CBS 101889]RAL13396.1 hypothetical protein BO97DRAFT_38405 [Aspergillus homomorphus CBS 101889]